MFCPHVRSIKTRNCFEWFQWFLVHGFGFEWFLWYGFNSFNGLRLSKRLNTRTRECHEEQLNVRRPGPLAMKNTIMRAGPKLVLEGKGGEVFICCFVCLCVYFFFFFWGGEIVLFVCVWVFYLFVYVLYSLCFLLLGFVFIFFQHTLGRPIIVTIVSHSMCSSWCF